VRSAASRPALHTKFVVVGALGVSLLLPSESTAADSGERPKIAVEVVEIAGSESEARIRCALGDGSGWSAAASSVAQFEDDRGAAISVPCTVRY